METRICGWDVGIKHLAYCIIKKTDNNFEIEQWQNIDIIDSDKIICCAKKKRKRDNPEELCGAIARFYINEENKINYYCGTHKDQNKEENIKKYLESIQEITEKVKCEFIIAKTQLPCDKKA